MLKEINLRTNENVHFLEITNELKSIVKESGIKNGLVHVYTPHTTAAITINENADPDVVEDIVMEINKVIPRDDAYQHLEGNSAAHIKSSLFGSSETLIIDDGKLILGTWQGVYFCEFDGARHRRVIVKVIKG
ncbi:secondary thiamine-phosphate synthase enzyme YjbQ [Natronospora cellulosivora (SeqCode)]